jgi:hypothetical protein
MWNDVEFSFQFSLDGAFVGNRRSDTTIIVAAISKLVSGDD